MLLQSIQGSENLSTIYAPGDYILRIDSHCDSPFLRRSLHDGPNLYKESIRHLSNAQRARQVKTQGNSKRALKIIKITAHTNRTIGMVISISFMGLRKTRSSEARESTSFVFECTMIHLVSRVICFSGYLSMQVIYRYGLTKSGIGAREICPKISHS